MKIRGFVGAARARMRQLRRNFLQSVDRFLHTRPHADDANFVPHQVLNLADDLLNSGVNGTIGIGRLRRRPWRFHHFYLRAHCFSGTSSKDQAFEQRVTGQAIGAVYASVGNFTRCVKAGNAGSSVRIGAHAAHGEMQCGTNRNKIFGDVDVMTHERRVNPREPLLYFRRGHVGEVQVDEGIFGAADFHFMHDGARHQIARGYFSHRVIFPHEAIQFNVAENGSFSTQMFAEQKTRRFFDVKHRGMVLEKFHIPDLRASAVSKRDAICGRSFRIGRVAADLAQTAGRQQHGRTGDVVRRAFVIENGNAGHAPRVCKKCSRKDKWCDRNVFQGMRFGVKRAQDFGGGGFILGMQNAIVAPCAILAENKFCISGSPGDQLLDSLDAFLNQNFCGGLMAKTVARSQRVLQMQADLVLVAESVGTVVLRVGGRDGIFLGENEHTSCSGQFDRGPQSRDSGSNDNEVGLGWKTLHRGDMVPLRRRGEAIFALTLSWNRMAQVTIHVPPRPYQAMIENGLLMRAGSVLADLLPQASRIFVVTVPPVRKRWAGKLLRSLKAAGFAAEIIPMPDGEPAKRLSTIEALSEKLVRLGADRKAVILALGGGVVGDVSGLLASLYMRGVELVQIPTTVLAQVDASIGGKTAVNLVAGKNLIGTFYHPRVVLIDPAVLKTLPEREFRAGLYESLKCAVIGNIELFLRFEQGRARILKRDPAELEWVIAQSVRLKAEVVSADEREGGLRRVLNLGHTIGHALEAETGYRRLLHGEAVAWGMIAATNIALSVGRTDSVTAGRIADAVLSLGRLPEVNVSARKIRARLQSDKKTQNGVVHFILPREIGKVEVASDVPERVVLDAVEELRRLSHGGGVWGR